MDACLLAGGVYDCPPLPSLAESVDSIGPSFTFDRAADVLRTYGSGIQVIRDLAPESDYMDKFARTKGLLNFVPIFKYNSTIETLSKKAVPKDIQTVVTPRLANEIYMYLSRRFVGCEMYDLLLSEHLRIPTSWEGSNQEMAFLAGEMISVMVLCLNLLSQHSNRGFQHKHLVCSFTVINADCHICA
jgi:Temperature dependent protein affecting M2 dsRNA replication